MKKWIFCDFDDAKKYTYNYVIQMKFGMFQLQTKQTRTPKFHDEEITGNEYFSHFKNVCFSKKKAKFQTAAIFKPLNILIQNHFYSFMLKVY